MLTSVVKAVPRLPGAQSSQDNSLMMMLVTWMAVALMMFMMRPRSLRNKADADYRNNEVGFLVSVVLGDVITQQDARGRTWQSSAGLC